MKKRRIYWLVFGLLSVFLRMALVNAPAVVEQYYSRGFFQLVRFVSDWTIGFLPVPVLYVLVFTLPFWLIWQAVKRWRSTSGFSAKILQLIYSALAVAGGIVGLFLWLWGYNYLRIPIEEQMNISPVPLTVNELREELDFYTAKITTERFLILNTDNNAITASFLPVNLEKEMQDNITATMKSMNYPVSNNLPVRTLLKGSLLRIGTAGFYLPFTGECNIDDGLHPLQKPHVLAHEMAHGLGIGDEGSCNFIALLTCLHSNNTLVRYSGMLSYWRTLAVNYRRQAPDEYAKLRNDLPKGIIADLDAINKNSLSYPDIFPDLRDKTYDAFLKTQGIAEGMKNYNRVIVLASAWRKEKQGF